VTDIVSSETRLVDPAFAYSGMQYSRKASYYFAEGLKKLRLLRRVIGVRNIVSNEKDLENSG
jgi:hypothetical protein